MMLLLKTHKNYFKKKIVKKMKKPEKMLNLKMKKISKKKNIKIHSF